MQEPWTEGTKPWWEKGYAAWTWATTTQVVCVVPCELIYAQLSGSGAAVATLYDGVSLTGDVIKILRTAVAGHTKLNPPEPILCRRGIYVVNTANNVDGVLIMWRPLPAGWRP